MSQSATNYQRVVYTNHIPLNHYKIPIDMLVYQRVCVGFSGDFPWVISKYENDLTWMI